MPLFIQAMIVLWLFLGSAAQAQPQAQLEFFQPPFMSDEFVITDFRDISHDGSRMVGSAGPVRAVELMQVRYGVGEALGVFAEGYRRTQGERISGDGQVIFGRAFGQPEEVFFRWTEARGFETVPFHVTAVNHDGQLLAGVADGQWLRSSEQRGRELIRLGADLASWAVQSVVAMDASGEILVGVAIDSSQRRRGYVWRDGEAKLLDQLLPEGDLLIDDISSDGRVIIGRHFPQPGLEAKAFRYDLSLDELTRLPPIKAQPGWKLGGMVAEFINEDGSQIIGFQAIEVNHVNDFVPFVWTPEQSSRSLMQAMREDFGLDYEGDPLVNVRAVSKDGRVLYGVGRGKPGGSKQLDAWFVRIGLPGVERL